MIPRGSVGARRQLVKERGGNKVTKGPDKGEKKGGEAEESGPQTAGKKEPGNMAPGKGQEEPTVPETLAAEASGAPSKAEEEAEPDSVRGEVTPEERAAQLAKENEQLQDKYVRLMADFDNFRKRSGKEKSEIIRFGNEDLLKDILPIVDNIERLLTYSYQETNWKSFQEGIELLLADIGKTLANYGVEPIDALGKAFDPNLHEAMQRAETEEAPANTVVEVYQKGYLYRGRLLRPSLVVVAVPPTEVGEAEEQGYSDDKWGPGGGDGKGEGSDEDEEQPIN